MEQKAGAQISTRSFIQSLLILFVLMMAAGLLTRSVPPGSYARFEQDGRELIDPTSFQYTQPPDYPAWRWFTAPLEVLWGPDALTIIVIIVFLLVVGVSFAVLDKSGLLRSALGRIVRAFEGRKYQLLLVISLFFMAIGAFFGIFEEVVPLVPLMIALAYFLGWDALVGLGMSILAVNMGFSAAITNPFTLGVAQQLADLPLFSGAWLRILIFIAIYIVFSIFLLRYARKIERDPTASLVYAEGQAERAKYQDLRFEALEAERPRTGKAMAWLLVFLILILLMVVIGPFVPAIASFSLPVVGLLFFIGGVGASLISGEPLRQVFKAIGEGLTGIAPAIPLILMAASIKHIITQGSVLDTILYHASALFASASPFLAALLIYALALLIEFFVASGSAKAFLLMPLLIPLADLIGVTRQAAVTAYIFGDGFSNLAYPTNPVLLICLGLTVVSYPRWLKWTLPLWFWVLLVTVAFLGIGVAIGYGPF
ncbi:MAG: YfcC family protein [Anaerolineales bacterium]|nr:YfcC family protein [Anaerolineales bacterium]